MRRPFREASTRIADPMPLTRVRAELSKRAALAGIVFETSTPVDVAQAASLVITAVTSPHAAVLANPVAGAKTRAVLANAVI